MRKTGDYTLFIGDESTGRKITEIEYRKENSGMSGGKAFKTYFIKYKSFHYPDSYKYYGMVFDFILRDNRTRKMIKYEIGSKPKEIKT